MQRAPACRETSTRFSKMQAFFRGDAARCVARAKRAPLRAEQCFFQGSCPWKKQILIQFCRLRAAKLCRGLFLRARTPFSLASCLPFSTSWGALQLAARPFDVFDNYSISPRGAITLRKTSRRKRRLKIREAISAMGKDHHTAVTLPVKERK